MQYCIESDVEIQEEAFPPMFAREPETIKHEWQVERKTNEATQIARERGLAGWQDPKIILSAAQGEHQESFWVDENKVDGLGEEGAIYRGFRQSLQTIGYRRREIWIKVRTLVRMIRGKEPIAAV